MLNIIFRRSLWIEACSRPDLIGKTWEKLKNLYICSAHFEKRCYGKKSLKKIATPTLRLPIKVYPACTETDGYLGEEI